MNGFGTLTWSNVKSAIIYGLLTCLMTALYIVGSTILAHGSIYGVDWTDLLDKTAIAVIGVLVSITSILKNLLTNSKGEFLGLITVIPDKNPTEKTG